MTTDEERDMLMEQMVQTIKSISDNIERLAGVAKELRRRVEALEQRADSFSDALKGVAWQQ